MPHTHAKRPRRGRGRREARRLWDSRQRAGQPQREGSRNPRCRLAHLRRAERNPRPRRGQRTKPHPTTAPTAAPPPTSAPRHNKPHPVHVRPEEGKKRSGKATPGARHQPKKGTPAGRKYFNNGRAHTQRQRRRERPPPRPRKRNEPNTRPHHRRVGNSRASNQPARPDRRETNHPPQTKGLGGGRGRHGTGPRPGAPGAPPEGHPRPGRPRNPQQQPDGAARPPGRAKRSRGFNRVSHLFFLPHPWTGVASFT